MLKRQPAPREGLALGLVLALLAALPVLVAVHPQQADYAAHLARYHVMLHGADSAFLARYYDFRWALTGNLGVDLLMVPLGTLLGVERASWLIALLLPPFTGLAIISVEWTLRRKVGPGALLALTLVWSPAKLMGFANFCLALAPALFAFALWVRLEGKGWRAPLFILIGAVVWLCHSAGWGVLGVMVFGYEWHRSKGWRAGLRTWPLWLPFAITAATLQGASGNGYGDSVLAYKLSIWLKALADHHQGLDMLSVIAIVAVIAIAWRAGKLDGRLGWAALFVALLSLVLPRHFGGGDLADLRLVPVGLLLGCLAIDLKAPRWVLYLAPVLFLARLAVTSVAWHEESAQLQSALAGLEQIPEGARVAGAVALDPGQWGSHALAHAPSYATVYRDALVNSHFAIAGVHMLRLRVAAEGFTGPSQTIMAKRGETIDLAAFAPARRADYLWYFGTNPVSALPPGAQVLHRTPASLLLKLGPPQPRPAQSTGS
ncbi:hypothetical protein GRI99_16920 [Altererythrobacter buctensis]|uniref:Glycosyltransferase RgtA/B/C/D-like domain-containing protein n=2 Tax=Alteraurantiacibacter buctensis TaxID=1503981 RepID=A0A844Z2V1_9SPHN|nr:hypothetical protein [Alteraurantiacibacter buctensis]